jgi:hypothetical protein
VPTFSPTESERLIVRACLSAEETFSSALRDFDEYVSLDGLNQGAYRLLPYLYRRLETSQLESRYRGLLKGIYKREWYLHLVEGANWISHAEAVLEDIPFLVLKGVALRELIYGGNGALRPVHDLDIFVHPAQRVHAFSRFLRAGYVLEHPRAQARYLSHSESGRTNYLSLSPSIGLVKNGSRVDLHWSLYPTLGTSLLHEDLFGQAEIVAGPDHQPSFSTPSLTHHYLHTLAHGVGTSSVSPVRWIVDSHLLEAHPRFSSREVVETAIRMGWMSMLISQLRWRERFTQVEIPADMKSLLGNVRHVKNVRLGWASRRAPLGIMRRVLGVLIFSPLINHQLTGENLLRSVVRSIWFFAPRLGPLGLTGMRKENSRARRWGTHGRS